MLCFTSRREKPYRGAGRHGHKDAVPATELQLKDDENYGLSLDSQWLVVDFDREDSAKWKERLPLTWTVKTRRGEHWLYALPSGFVGKNAKFPSGELKVRGYIVGPGSTVNGATYELIRDDYPIEAPAWLLENCIDFSDKQESGTGEGGVDCIQDGQGRDDFLFAMASLGRRKGLSQRGLETLVGGLLESGVVEQGESPKTASDVKRIARSAAKFEAEDAVLLAPPNVVFGNELPKVIAPRKWWVHGFFPKGELVAMYGKGGIGKSSLASWLACEVAKKGGRTMTFLVEEPFWRFMWRCRLGGLDGEDMVCTYEGAGMFRLPRNVEALEKLIVDVGIDVVYFDSIYSHLEAPEGSNAAEKARMGLGPLGKLCERHGVTIVYTFHENKKGEMLGSTEMTAVARVGLHATRTEGGPMVVEVEKFEFD